MGSSDSSVLRLVAGDSFDGSSNRDVASDRDAELQHERVHAQALDVRQDGLRPARSTPAVPAPVAPAQVDGERHPVHSSHDRVDHVHRAAHRGLRVREAGPLLRVPKDAAVRLVELDHMHADVPNGQQLLPQDRDKCLTERPSAR